jgi:glycosyltransferase involved in cell wall biosynthesis
MFARKSALSLLERPEAPRQGGPGAMHPARAPGAPHVCFLAPLAWPVFIGDPDIKVVGGAEVQMSFLSRALAAAGLPVTMICFDYGQPARVTLDGVTVIKAHRPDEGIPVLRFVHPRFTSMWQAMRQADADVYYFRCSSVLAGFGAAFCRMHGKRSVYAGASDVDFVPGKELIRFARDRWIYQHGLRNVDAIIAQNSFQYESCREHYRREATVIPSCYKAPATRGADPAGHVLWAGAMRDYKRPELMLEIARRLPHRRFVMAGGADGDEASRQYFERLRREAQALGNVDLPGFVPFADIESMFDRASVLVNTSAFEGFPNTFLQAWARGIPSVAFVDTGSRHAGRPVYDIARDAADAAARIERLLSDRDHWHQASARCRDYFMSHHSVEAVTARYTELFTELAQRMPART